MEVGPDDEMGVATTAVSIFRDGVLRYSESTEIENRMELRPAAMIGSMLLFSSSSKNA